MRVVGIAATDSSGHYRIRQPIEELQRQGVKNLEVARDLRIEFDLAGPKRVFVEADLVVIQRPLMWFMPTVIDLLHEMGINVVIDMDDDFHTAHTSNVAFQLNHPRVNPAQNWNHLGKCIRKADLVTVSTPALARRYGSHGRVAVLRNSVDDDWLRLSHRGDGRTLGWAGTVVNHPTDLQATRGGVARALEQRPDWRFLCVGGQSRIDQVQKGLELREEPASTAWRELELHPMLVSGIDVGIVPLADTVFNQAKSWLKGIEYAALGIPFVASNLPEYEWLQEAYGLGVLADSKTKTWARQLGSVMDGDIERKRLREIVRRHLTISVNAWRWQEVWESLRCPRFQRERVAVR